jgi:hypothetical protein
MKLTEKKNQSLQILENYKKQQQTIANKISSTAAFSIDQKESTNDDRFEVGDQSTENQYRATVDRVCEWIQWTRRCIGADVVSRLGVSSEALSSISADKVGSSDSGGNHSVLFGHVKPSPPLPKSMTENNYISKILAPEAQALERTCSRLVGLLSERENKRQEQFRISLKKAWSAVSTTKKREQEKAIQAINKVINEKDEEIVTITREMERKEREWVDEIKTIQNRSKKLILDAENSAKESYDRGREYQKSETERIINECKKREELCQERERSVSEENERMRERIAHLESEARPEALAEARHISNQMEKALNVAKIEISQLERQLNQVEENCSDQLVSNRNEHEKRLLALRNAHEERLSIIQSKTM